MALLTYKPQIPSKAVINLIVIHREISFDLFKLKIISCFRNTKQTLIYYNEHSIITSCFLSYLTNVHSHYCDHLNLNVAYPRYL